MTGKLSAVLFDAGGTLVGASDMFEIMLNTFKLPKAISKDELGRRFMALKNDANAPFLNVKDLLRALFLTLSRENGIDDHGEQAVELYQSIFTQSVYLYEGVLETLSHLRKANVRIILVSDADHDVLEPQFEKLGINSFFEQKIISSNVKAYKPSDRMVEFIKLNCDINPQSTLFVGDSGDDIETARKLGSKSIFIGSTPKESTHFVTSFSEISELLKLHYGLEGITTALQTAG